MDERVGGTFQAVVRCSDCGGRRFNMAPGEDSMMMFVCQACGGDEGEVKFTEVLDG